MIYCIYLKLVYKVFQKGGHGNRGIHREISGSVGILRARDRAEDGPTYQCDKEMATIDFVILLYALNN